MHLNIPSGKNRRPYKLLNLPWITACRATKFFVTTYLLPNLIDIDNETNVYRLHKFFTYSSPIKCFIIKSTISKYILNNIIHPQKFLFPIFLNFSQVFCTLSHRSARSWNFIIRIHANIFKFDIHSSRYDARCAQLEGAASGKAERGMLRGTNRTKWL